MSADSTSLDHKELQSFGNVEFIARQVVSGFITGLHKSPFHGFSVEFSEHRQYNTGESTRHIDWKLYGRTDKLYVKRYEEETNLRCQLIIDNSSSMYFPVQKELSWKQPNKLLFSIYAAGSLIYLLKQQRDASGLSIFSDSVETHLPAHSNQAHLKLMFHHLENLVGSYNEKSKKKTFTADALHQIAEQIHKRSLVILFSDMFESGEDVNSMYAALQHLKHNKHEVILFHVTDKAKELEFNYDNRPYKFVDMETGEEVKLNPQNIKQSYKEAAEKFRSELKLRCGQYHIDFVEANINEGFQQVLLTYLLKRQRMF